LVDSNRQSGKLVGERILKKICSQNYNIDINDNTKCIKLSVSIGVAEFPTDAKNSQEVLAIADRMMYEAKESGRGLVFDTQDVFKSSLKKIIEQK
jgi:diguanylate cyclase (GGDEF)-like protein